MNSQLVDSHPGVGEVTMRGMRASGFTRRGLLIVAGRMIGLLGLSGWLSLALQACGASEEARPNPQLIQALRLLIGDPDNPGRLVGFTQMTPRVALRTLRGDLAPERLNAIAIEGALLAAHVERLRAADLAAGRLRYAEGWLLADTEIAIAVLLGL